MPGKLFIVSAPSGAGKTTLVQSCMDALGSAYKLSRIVTYTSRTPRAHERQGVDYHFVSPAEFELLQQENFFLESSQAYGHYYGTPRSLIEHLEHGAACIVILDRQGAKRLFEQVPAAYGIWIMVPSIECLRERLVARNQNSPEQIERRLTLAQLEIEEEFNRPLYHHYIMNDDKQRAVERFKNIVIAAIESPEAASE